MRLSGPRACCLAAGQRAPRLVVWEGGERGGAPSAIMEAVRWPRRKWQSQKGEDKGKKGGCHPHLLRRLWLAACSSLFFLSGRHLLCSQSQLSSPTPSLLRQTARLADPKTPLYFRLPLVLCQSAPSNVSLLSISILVGRHPERKMTRRNGTEREIKKYI